MLGLCAALTGPPSRWHGFLEGSRAMIREIDQYMNSVGSLSSPYGMVGYKIRDFDILFRGDAAVVTFDAAAAARIRGAERFRKNWWASGRRAATSAIAKSVVAAAERFAQSGANLVRLEFPKTEIQVSGNTAIVYSTHLYEIEQGSIWKTMMVAEMSFRKLDAPQLVEKVARGTKYDNDEEVRDAA